MDTSVLRLVADDADGLAVIASAVQDALLRRADMRLDRSSRTFGLEINRFQWERAGRKPPYFRSRAVLAFGGVLAARSNRVPTQSDAVLSLLDMRFTPGDVPPDGKVRLVFAGGSEIELIVECLDATLMDTGASWPTRRKPDHGDL
jgi:hypothetical protein